ncbi:probable rRNA maturation factor [Jatrophihabitans endophyticus]|uniref:Endoribonuclease YbeY n=1 Tax=Jatrophihabitans endophyticus TaxID=1206085 RepID=A0A1M5KFB0_9ACTN|nr:rRNA maturation RNase YbeY [Jatrophihabitans endophyticus]SHG51300.1 probable rRNA maturation factor [Jatrophihabitans endophyticus]
MSVEVSNESGAEADEHALAELGRFVLDALGIDPLADLSVLLVDTDTMAALHQQWMDLPGPTDVMAFPMDAADGGAGGIVERVDPSAPPGTDENPRETMLGDVVLCPAVAADQAASAGHSTQAELHLLCTHGILHLLGYDHGEADEEREMFDLQAQLTRDWTRTSGVGPIRAPLPGTAGEVRGTG